MERFEDQYELVAGNVNKLFSQMHAAYEELNKFKTELTDFRIWMGQAFDVSWNIMTVYYCPKTTLLYINRAYH